MAHNTLSKPPSAQRIATIRSALILAVVALVSFGGIILAEYTGSPEVGIGVLGVILIAFLLAAMTRRGHR